MILLMQLHLQQQRYLVPISDSYGVLAADGSGFIKALCYKEHSQGRQELFTRAEYGPENEWPMQECKDMQFEWYRKDVWPVPLLSTK